MDFFQVATVAEVREVLASLALTRPLNDQTVGLAEALGRVCAGDVLNPADIPAFCRSTVDGYAVRARDIAGAAESLPTLLSRIGEVKMGTPADLVLGPGEAVAVPTGGMVPQGADAMTMVEFCETLDDRTVLVARPSAPGDHLVGVGEDLPQGAPVAAAGRILGPFDIALLAGAGLSRVAVKAQPRVAVISTGDELAAPPTPLAPAQVYDMNGPALAAAAAQAGGLVVRQSLVADGYQELCEELTLAASLAEVVLISGGSSVGARDHTRAAIESLEGARVLVHGVAVKPGKPTILATRGSAVVFGLPGHPASALVIFELLVRFYLDRLQGVSRSGWDIPARIDTKVHGAPGRTTCQLVSLRREGPGWRAAPIHVKAGLVSPLARADGFVLLDPESEGLMEGAPVRVIPFGRRP